METPAETPPACASCAAPLAGPYCHACGEHRLPPGHLGLGRYLRDAFEDLTSADGVLWRSLRALLFRPGLLTREWLAGRRRPFVRPFRLFLVCNVAFFLVLSLAGGSVFRGQESSQTGNPYYGSWAAERLDMAVAGAGVSHEVYVAAFNQHAETLSRTLIVLLVPLVALLMWVLMGWRRVPAVTHVVFATHVVAAMMAVTVTIAVVLVPVVMATQLLRLRWYPSLDPVILVVVLGYFVLAIRRAYGVRLAAAAGLGALGMAGLMACVVVFQFVLFVLTVWTLSL